MIIYRFYCYKTCIFCKNQLFKKVYHLIHLLPVLDVFLFMEISEKRIIPPALRKTIVSYFHLPEYFFLRLVRAFRFFYLYGETKKHSAICEMFMLMILLLICIKVNILTNVHTALQNRTFLNFNIACR